jgi:hypothetical protein
MTISAKITLFTIYSLTGLQELWLVPGNAFASPATI